MGNPEQGGLSADILSQTAVPAVPASDPQIAHAYETVRAYLRESGVEPTHDSRVAFADDPARHTSPLLGGSRANEAETERVALVQAWEVGGRYELQVHIYDPTHPSVAPLLRIVGLAEETLPADQRDAGTDSVASRLNASDFSGFINRIAALKAA